MGSRFKSANILPCVFSAGNPGDYHQLCPLTSQGRTQMNRIPASSGDE